MKTLTLYLLVVTFITSLALAATLAIGQYWPTLALKINPLLVSFTLTIVL